VTLIQQAADVVIASDVPIKVDAGSIYDTLSEKEREALRQVYDIGDRVRERLFARAGVNWRNLRGKSRELRARQIDTLMCCSPYREQSRSSATTTKLSPFERGRGRTRQSGQSKTTDQRASATRSRT
jgi:hypothetical protein